MEDLIEGLSCLRGLNSGDENCPEVLGKLQKESNSRVRMSSILIQEGSYLKVSRHLFKAVVQAVLLFGAETWVLILWI